MARYVNDKIKVFLCHTSKKLFCLIYLDNFFVVYSEQIKGSHILYCGLSNLKYNKQIHL